MRRDLKTIRKRLLTKFQQPFLAHTVPQREEHERERSLQRFVIVSLVCGVWLADFLTNSTEWSTNRGIALITGTSYALAALVYRLYLQKYPHRAILAQYLFLILDPIVLLAGMVVDPARLASLHPFIFIVIIRCGIRYGISAMWMAWGVTVASALVLLPQSEYWLKERELSLAFGLLLALIPVFFISLIQRVHNIRAIEEERARLLAVHEGVVARSAFLSKISHELRSPLQSIVSALDTFELRHLHRVAEDDALIGRMRRSSMLLNTQLRDLLTLAKGQAGHLEMRPEPFEATALMEGVAMAARDAARAKGLELKLEVPATPEFLVADGARIDQVLTNLVTNSLRYTNKGEVRLTLHPYEQETQRMHFSVADTGPGIPAEVLPTLLEPDKLVANPARKGEGSGIGLAVVRTLIDHLGGIVTVTSREDEGTIFEIKIPAQRIDPEEPTHNESTGAHRVLIIDDREDVLDGLSSVINELGYDCDRASTTAAAADLLATSRYDAVLFDIQMPNKSGAELAAETRTGQGPNRATRLIGMSAAEVTAQHSDGPFDACLNKPIDRNALANALRIAWPAESRPASTV